MNKHFITFQKYFIILFHLLSTPLFLSKFTMKRQSLSVIMLCLAYTGVPPFHAFIPNATTKLLDNLWQDTSLLLDWVTYRKYGQAVVFSKTFLLYYLGILQPLTMDGFRDGLFQDETHLSMGWLIKFCFFSPIVFFFSMLMAKHSTTLMRFF